MDGILFVSFFELFLIGGFTVFSVEMYDFDSYHGAILRVKEVFDNRLSLYG
jgi:hypothetical protein